MCFSPSLIALRYPVNNMSIKVAPFFFQPIGFGMKQLTSFGVVLLACTWVMTSAGPAKDVESFETPDHSLRDGTSWKRALPQHHDFSESRKKKSYHGTSAQGKDEGQETSEQSLRGDETWRRALPYMEHLLEQKESPYIPAASILPTSG